MSGSRLSHVDDQGRARMVDVSRKDRLRRTARAAGRIDLAPATVELVRTNGLDKGDVLAAARIAGIMAAKRTSDLIPLCHPLSLTRVSVELGSTDDPAHCGVSIIATAETDGKTGVEMEALTAASVAALTIYDMCKAVDRGMVISDVRLLAKEGGKSGTWTREEQAE
jgi:cyclic pyranopterin phosphate synthase